jgi:hypothetical protein
MNRPYRLTLPAAIVPALAFAAALALLMPLVVSASPASGGGTAESISPSPATDPALNRVLRAMNNASTWGHPDQYGEYTGMRLYSEGRYKDAIEYFKYGARYADKFSQLAIGLMYANGRGVKQSPVTACAWLALAAQTKAPGFVATRNRVCKALTPAQHEEAVAVLNKLLPVYGDKAAMRNMAGALNLGKMQTTGSRLGFDSGIWNTPPTEFSMTDGGAPYPDGKCAGPTLIAASEVPVSGCGSTNFWVAARWDPKLYFAMRREHWLGIVTVGAAKQSGSSASAAKSKPAPADGADH